MRYNFELRKEKINQNGLIPLRLVVSNEKDRIRKSINAKTAIENWDNINLQINNPNSQDNKNYKLYQKFNITINEVKSKVDKIFSYFEYNEIPFSEKLFNEKYDEDDVKVTITFADAYEEFIKVSKLTKTNSTVIKYRSIKNFLDAFELHSKFILKLDNIDFRFEEQFMDYCFNIKKTLNNYYAKIIKGLKAFMNWAHDRGYHKNLSFKKLKSKEEEVEVIYLTIDELMKLYHHPFSNPAKDRARDFFCLMCFTGQRHSDIYVSRSSNLLLSLQFFMFPVHFFVSFNFYHFFF